MYKTAAEIKELVDVFHLLAEGWNTIKDYPELYADTPDYYERLSALREQIRQTIAVWKNDRVNDKLAKLGHGNRVEEHLLEAETLRDDLLEARQLRGPITDQQTELLANARREVNTLTQTRAARAKVNA